MCQQVPAVPEALQQTLRDDGTISAWMQLPPLQCPPHVIYLEAVSLCLPGGCRREQPLPWAATPQPPQPVDPHGEGAQGMVQRVHAMMTGGCSSQQRAHSSAGLWQQPEPPNSAFPQTAAVPRGDSTGSATQGCISKRSDRNSTRAPSSVHSVSSAAGQNEFYSPRFCFASGDIKRQERNHNERPGAATVISLSGPSANSPLSFPLLSTFHT